MAFERDEIGPGDLGSHESASSGSNLTNALLPVLFSP
jgi:hypothetical protein